MANGVVPSNVYPANGQRPNSGLTINIQKTTAPLPGGAMYLGGVPQMPMQMVPSPTASSVAGARSPYTHTPTHFDMTPQHQTVHNGQLLSADARTHSREALTPLTPNVGPSYS
eukprot:GDKI01022896.1.p1 GENE.GDKI01022896.1~~GDKI01022896.1.p1  ORF type:complete len:120 (-),score=31.70 GDKI01022896.1:149-487(-)